jgi:hypothetical protein
VDIERAMEFMLGAKIAQFTELATTVGRHEKEMKAIRSILRRPSVGKGAAPADGSGSTEKLPCLQSPSCSPKKKLSN